MMKLQPTNPAMKFPNTYGKHIDTATLTFYIANAQQKRLIVDAISELNDSDSCIEVWGWNAGGNPSLVVHMTDLGSYTNYTVHIPFEFDERRIFFNGTPIGDNHVYTSVDTCSPLVSCHDVQRGYVTYVANKLCAELVYIAAWRIRKELECLR